MYCDVKLTKNNLRAFEFAIRNYYSYQMYIDDLPIMGTVGDYDEADKSCYLWTHKKFDLGFNGNRIVDVNMTSEGKVKLELDKTIVFSYEVNWKPSQVAFADRFDKYLDPSFFQHRIHWFSIFNSFMMVIFLVGLVGMILMRTLRKDYARYNRDEEMDDLDRDLGDEYGWKQVHGDVFRAPSYPMAFSILIGTGYHVSLVTLIVIVFAILGDLYESRGKLSFGFEFFNLIRFIGSMLSAFIFAYAAMAPVNGYFGGSLYSRFGGKRWIKQMFLSAAALPTLVCGTAFFINFIAIYYHASRAIHFTTMVSDNSLVIGCTEIHGFFKFSVGCGKHLHIHHPPTNPCGHRARSQRQWPSQQSVSRECCAQTYSGEKVVHGAVLHCSSWWHSSLW